MAERDLGRLLAGLAPVVRPVPWHRRDDAVAVLHGLA